MEEKEVGRTAEDEQKNSDRWVMRSIIIPGIICFILMLFGVPYVGYFIPVVILLAFVAAGIGSAFTGGGVVLRLCSFVFGLMMAYGAFAFIFPGTLAEHIVPPGWRWPAGERAEALSLPNGEWAVALESTPRVQIYDGEGTYLRGWFVPASGGFFFISLPPDDAGEGIWVRVARGDSDLHYSLQGELLAESEKRDRAGRLRIGHFETRSFPMRWYEWPLVYPPYGWLCGALGMIGLILVQYFDGWKKGVAAPPTEAIRTFMRKNPDTKRKVVAILCCVGYLFLFYLMVSTSTFKPGGFLGILLFLGPPICIYHKLVLAHRKPHYDRGLELLAAGDADEAVQELEEAVRSESHVGAALRLADMYLRGEGVAANRKKAEEYYGLAKQNIGFFLFRNQTAENAGGLAGSLSKKMLYGQTLEMITEWTRRMSATLEQQAEQGELWAVRLLADLHGLPRNPAADPELAIKYSRQLYATENTPESLATLGRRLVARRHDTAEGVECLERAFAQGNLAAGQYLVMAYTTGIEGGLEKDWNEARKWIDAVLATPSTSENDPDDTTPVFAATLGAVLMEEGMEETLTPDQSRLLYSLMRKFKYARKEVVARWKEIAKRT